MNDWWEWINSDSNNNNDGNDNIDMRNNYIILKHGRLWHNFENGDRDTNV